MTRETQGIKSLLDGGTTPRRSVAKRKEPVAPAEDDVEDDYEDDEARKRSPRKRVKRALENSAVQVGCGGVSVYVEAPRLRDCEKVCRKFLKELKRDAAARSDGVRGVR